MSRRISRFTQVALWVAGVTLLSAAAVFAVWFVGFDTLWAVAGVVAAGSVSAILATLKFEEHAAWDPPGRETPRGVRLALPMMEKALAACDRLARPAITRPLRILLTNERDDRLARGTILRQTRALLVAELRARGITADHQTDEAVIALLGRDALTVLEPTESNPVTSAAIANCLDTIERLPTEPLTSR